MKKLLALMILIAGCTTQPSADTVDVVKTSDPTVVHVGDATVTLTEDLTGTTNCNPLARAEDDLSAADSLATEEQTRNLMDVFSKYGGRTNFCGWYCGGQTYCCDGDIGGRCCCKSPVSCQCNF
jgi:hypothetical protein